MRPDIFVKAIMKGANPFRQVNKKGHNKFAKDINVPDKNVGKLKDTLTHYRKVAYHGKPLRDLLPDHPGRAAVLP